MGIDKKIIMDGCTSATHIAYAISDVATIYPISPASDMGELADKWASTGRKNLMGQTMTIHEMQSEAGAAGAVHGCLAGGALTTTFTASQGLLLMIPNMYKISGELLPGVFHVSARSLSAHALSIFGDHQDVMACRQTGFAFIASASVQECMDLALVAHLSAIDGSIPFCHFFDGMRTSAEMQSVNLIDYDDIDKLINRDKIDEFRKRAMNPEHPDVRGTAQNPDVYFQNREAANSYYDNLPGIVKNNMNKVSSLTGREYNLFDYCVPKDAEYIIIAMCSACEVIEETINYLIKSDIKVGLIKVRLYRPFSVKDFINSIPKTTKVLCTLDRTKEPGAQGEPLYQDIVTAIHTNDISIKVIGGRYGLSSKELTPSMVKAVFDNMQGNSPKQIFTIGIDDDKTNLSLKVTDQIISVPKDTIQCKFFGIGSDGTVGANKQAANIIGNNTDLFVQAHFAFDSKKSEGYTVSHLRFAKEKIQSAYLIINADYIACHKSSFVNKFEVLDGIKDGGIFVLNSNWTLSDMEKMLPPAMCQTIAKKKIKFYNIDATKIAGDVGLGVRINMVMLTVFFKLVNIMDFDKAIALLKQNIKYLYEKEGTAVIDMNYKAIDKTLASIEEIKYPESWCDRDATEIKSIYPNTDNDDSLELFIKDVARPILSLNGDSLPVSKFSPDGKVPTGTTAYEKRGVAVFVPYWDKDKCIECCQCSFVCPHAAIRPFLATAEELNGAPDSFTYKAASGGDLFKGLSFRIQNYTEDCLGCGSCINVCPGKALAFKTFHSQLTQERENLNFALNNIKEKSNLLPRNTVKGSQLYKPLLEFSGACAGCGETPYVKLLTQLFGERMIIANATGCSSIWGASMPSMPYTKNNDGFGPAWGNSLFEDAAEYGYGIYTGINHRREKLSLLIEEISKNNNIPDNIQDALAKWNENKNNPDLSFKFGRILLQAINDLSDKDRILKQIYENGDLLGKKSIWVVGGDGWAYDIGFGGVDHVLATGANINMIVLDTECYSNTGGQTSKATPLGAVAKFSSTGKRTNKKELGRMLMTYDKIYVASIAIGTDKQQAINALCEAEAFDGPSIVIAYCPCINQGLRKGMGTSILEEDEAVKCGYWPLYRYNSDLIKEGKEPLILDYKKPDGTMPEFLDGEDRYATLKEQHPQEAEILRKGLEDNCDRQYDILSDSETFTQTP